MKKIFYTLLLLIASVHGSDFTLYVGPHFSYTRLKFDNPATLDGFSGGVTAGAGLTICDFLVLVDFDGSWDAAGLHGNPCQESSIENYYLEGKIGYNWVVCNSCFSIAPYSGFGWDRLLNEQNPHTASLTYTYDKLFVPAGVFVTWAPCPGFQMGAQFEWRFDVYSRLRIGTSNLDNDCEHGCRVQLPVSWNMRSCECLYVEITPFFDWAKYGKAVVHHSSGATLTIPATLRWNYGARVLLGYCF